MELIVEDKQRTITVSDTVFNCKYNKTLVHQAVIAYLSGARKGSKSQKSRSEVSGSNKKPWRQKGTGRARAGTLKSPIWRSGGVTFASKPKNYNQKINKKMYCGAIKNIISNLIKNYRLSIIDKLEITKPKTKLFIDKYKKFFYEKKILFIIENIDKNLFLASRNIYYINICKPLYINPINLITHNKVICTTEAIKKIEEMLL